jgi:hypothetical protein
MYMSVSINGGCTPKSPVSIGISIINHPVTGVPPVMETSTCKVPLNLCSNVLPWQAVVRQPREADGLGGTIPTQTVVEFVFLFPFHKGKHGDGSKPCTPGEPQNSW